MTRFSLLTLPEVSVLSRRMATLSVVAVILVTATSCTATVPSDQLEVAETVDMCAAAAAPGVASDAVEATGEIGTSASATFASPLTVTRQSAPSSSREMAGKSRGPTSSTTH